MTTENSEHAEQYKPQVRRSMEGKQAVHVYTIVLLQSFLGLSPCGLFYGEILILFVNLIFFTIG